MKGVNALKTMTPRLAAVAAMVRGGARVADIGTDHALLPVFLVEGGRCPAAIASDIGEGPAASARHTVTQAGLEAVIPVRVGDGLVPILPDEVDDIVIAGMGGETIAGILQAAPWVKSQRYHLVLQPMSKPERLRRFLAENGFLIQKEDIIAEGKRLYTVMSVTFTGEEQTPTLAACLMGQVPATLQGVLYMKKQRDRIVERRQGLPDSPENAKEKGELAKAEEQLTLWILQNEKA